MRTAASTCDLSSAGGPERLGHAHRPWRSSIAAALALTAGCTASADEVHPPKDVLSFPSGMAMAPDESVLFVANANSELRYDSGSISVLDMPTIRGAVHDWLAGGRVEGALRTGCEIEDGHPETMVCGEADFMNVDAGVRIGNFATDLALQVFDAAAGRYRVFVPTRGDPSVTWADFSNGVLTCTEGTDAFELCDDAHRLSQLENNPDLQAIPEEPYGVFADGRNGFAMITHLSSGAVTLIAAPPITDDGPADVRIVDIRAGFFNGNGGAPGATSIVGRPTGTGEPTIYVGSQTDQRVQTFTVANLPVTAPNEPAYLLPGDFFLLGSVGGSVGGSTDNRGMRFSDDGNRLYLVNRQPASLSLYDTSLSPAGFPRNDALGGIDVCRQASQVTVLGTGDDERAYVTCFQDGQVYVVDRRDLAQPEDIVLVGRGPYAVVGAKGTPATPGVEPGPDQRQLLFVSNFLEDTIAVVDVTRGSATYDRVVLRIGTPRIP